MYRWRAQEKKLISSITENHEVDTIIPSVYGEKAAAEERTTD